MDEDKFEPRLGRIRSIGSRRGHKYLHQVIAATARAGGIPVGGARRFDGSRIAAADLWLLCSLPESAPSAGAADAQSSKRAS
jgi:hypothetical protein